MCQEKKLYTNADFLVSTYIYSLGYKLVEINWLSNNKAEFIFEDSDSIKADISKFWAGEALVDARKILQAQKELKQRLYGSK